MLFSIRVLSRVVVFLNVAFVVSFCGVSRVSAENIFTGTANHGFLADGSVGLTSGTPNPPHGNLSTSRSVGPKAIFDDARFLFTSPEFLLVMGSVALPPVVWRRPFQTEDPEVNEMWKNSATADGIFDAGSVMGQGGYHVAAGLGSYLAGRALKSDRLESFGSDLFRAQVINGAITLGMKALVNRRRPDGTPWGYPSGHTSVSFASAAVVYRHFGPFVGVPAFVVSTYIGLSRLQANKHYLSDVVAGAALGGYIGYKIAGRSEGKTSLRISPTVGSQNGLMLQMKF